MKIRTKATGFRKGKYKNKFLEYDESFTNIINSDNDSTLTSNKTDEYSILNSLKEISSCVSNNYNSITKTILTESHESGRNGYTEDIHYTVLHCEKIKHSEKIGDALLSETDCDTAYSYQECHSPQVIDTNDKNMFWPFDSDSDETKSAKNVDKKPESIKTHSFVDSQSMKTKSFVDSQSLLKTKSFVDSQSQIKTYSFVDSQQLIQAKPNVRRSEATDETLKTFEYHDDSSSYWKKMNPENIKQSNEKLSSEKNERNNEMRSSEKNERSNEICSSEKNKVTNEINLQSNKIDQLQLNQETKSSINSKQPRIKNGSTGSDIDRIPSDSQISLHKQNENLETKTSDVNHTIQSRKSIINSISDKQMEGTTTFKKETMKCSESFDNDKKIKDCSVVTLDEQQATGPGVLSKKTASIENPPLSKNQKSISTSITQKDRKGSTTFNKKTITDKMNSSKSFNNDKKLNDCSIMPLDEQQATGLLSKTTVSIEDLNYQQLSKNKNSISTFATDKDRKGSTTFYKETITDKINSPKSFNNDKKINDSTMPLDEQQSTGGLSKKTASIEDLNYQPVSKIKKSISTSITDKDKIGSTTFNKEAMIDKMNSPKSINNDKKLNDCSTMPLDEQKATMLFSKKIVSIEDSNDQPLSKNKKIISTSAIDKDRKGMSKFNKGTMTDKMNSPKSFNNGKKLNDCSIMPLDEQQATEPLSKNPVSIEDQNYHPLSKNQKIISSSITDKDRKCITTFDKGTMTDKMNSPKSFNNDKKLNDCSTKPLDEQQTTEPLSKKTASIEDPNYQPESKHNKSIATSISDKQREGITVFNKEMMTSKIFDNDEMLNELQATESLIQNTTAVEDESHHTLLKNQKSISSCISDKQREGTTTLNKATMTDPINTLDSFDIDENLDMFTSLVPLDEQQTTKVSSKNTVNDQESRNQSKNQSTLYNKNLISSPKTEIIKFNNSKNESLHDSELKTYVNCEKWEHSFISSPKVDEIDLVYNDTNLMQDATLDYCMNCEILKNKLLKVSNSPFNFKPDLSQLSFTENKITLAGKMVHIFWDAGKMNECSNTSIKCHWVDEGYLTDVCITQLPLLCNQYKVPVKNITLVFATPKEEIVLVDNNSNKGLRESLLFESGISLIIGKILDLKVYNIIKLTIEEEKLSSTKYEIKKILCNSKEKQNNVMNNSHFTSNNIVNKMTIVHCIWQLDEITVDKIDLHCPELLINGNGKALSAIDVIFKTSSIHLSTSQFTKTNYSDVEPEFARKYEALKNSTEKSIVEMDSLHNVHVCKMKELMVVCSS